MTSNKKDINLIPAATAVIPASTSGLLKQIFESSNPAAIIHSLPAQTLYLIIRTQGLSSFVDILDLLPLEKLKLVLDFDLWQGDTFNEDLIWEWLELPDAADDLAPLQRLLQAVDLKLIALLISRYVDFVVAEDPTDLPPDEYFHTADKGQTWVKVNCHDEHKDFLLKRLIALIFETQAEMYYQLLHIPQVATGSSLEEQSYIDKTARLTAEGIPDYEWAAVQHNSLTLKEALKTVDTVVNRGLIEDIHSVVLFSRGHSIPSPLRDHLLEIHANKDLEEQITQIVNSAIVFFRVSWSETKTIEYLIEQVRGIMNIGLEMILLERPEKPPQEIDASLGLAGLYRLGLGQLFSLRKLAFSLNESICQDDPVKLTILEMLKNKIPELPQFLSDKRELLEESPGKLKSGSRPIESLKQVRLAEQLIAQISSEK